MNYLVAASELARTGPAPPPHYPQNQSLPHHQPHQRHHQHQHCHQHHSHQHPHQQPAPNQKRHHHQQQHSPPSSPFSSSPPSPTHSPPSPPPLRAAPARTAPLPTRVAPPAPTSAATASPVSNALPAPATASAPHLAAARAAASDAILSCGITVPPPTFDLAPAIIRATPLVEAPRRGDRILPGRSDTSVAACYMLGGTPDASLSGLLEKWDLTAPRAARVKRAEAAYKDRVKEIIAALNERGARESRAENLAALRVCEVVADLLDGHKVREMTAAVQERDAVIEELRRQVYEMQRGGETPASGTQRWQGGDRMMTC